MLSEEEKRAIERCQEEHPWVNKLSDMKKLGAESNPAFKDRLLDEEAYMTKTRNELLSVEKMPLCVLCAERYVDGVEYEFCNDCHKLEGVEEQEDENKRDR